MKRLVFSLLLTASTLLAETPADDATPRQYRADRYAPTWERNPFLIKMKDPGPNSESFAIDWELKYLTERSGVVKAGIQNRKTQEYRHVTTAPDAEGFQLVSCMISRARKDSQAEISKGDEKATFKYESRAQAPAPGPRLATSTSPLPVKSSMVRRRVLAPVTPGITPNKTAR